MADQSDLEEIYALICELAVYEKEPNEPTISLDDFKRDFENNKPNFEILCAEQDGKIVGMALYFFTYSTWKGRVLYLEDFYVKPEFRKKGIGSRVFNELKKIAKAAKCGRFAWLVLDWNEPAINFYKKQKAVLDPEWINGKYTEDQINQF